MKIEKMTPEDFTPFRITIETKDEAIVLWNVINAFNNNLGNELSIIKSGMFEVLDEVFHPGR